MRKLAHLAALAVIAIAAFTSAAAVAQEARQAALPAGSPISVTVEGQGPDVILIPGLASPRDVWAGLAKTLGRTHRLHLVQVAGFAGAPPVARADGRVVAPVAEAVAAYAKRERLRAPVVIGHSMGGAVGLMVAARHPEVVGRVMVVDALPFFSVLFDPAATAEAMEPRAAMFRGAMLAATPEQADASQRAAMRRLVNSAIARPAATAAALASDRRTVADATYELMTTDLRPELAAIRVPVRVIYAFDAARGEPAAATDATFARAYAGVRDLKLARVDGSAHFVMLDQPDAFARAVGDALGE